MVILSIVIRRTYMWYIYQVVTSLLMYTLLAQSVGCMALERNVRVRISRCRVFFSVYFYFLLISKDGCEKGQWYPKVLDINALVGVQEFT